MTPAFVIVVAGLLAALSTSLWIARRDDRRKAAERDVVSLAEFRRPPPRARNAVRHTAPVPVPASAPLDAGCRVVPARQGRHGGCVRSWSCAGRTRQLRREKPLMAHGKGRGARDLRYGRRGGGWLPDGFDPNAPRGSFEKVRSKDDERKEAQSADVAAYETANDLVPGTAYWRGDERTGGPAGGQAWEGRACMATARDLAGVPLDAVDRDALARHPNPLSGLTGRDTTGGTPAAGGIRTRRWNGGETSMT